MTTIKKTTPDELFERIRKQTSDLENSLIAAKTLLRPFQRVQLCAESMRILCNYALQADEQVISNLGSIKNLVANMVVDAFEKPSMPTSDAE